VDNAAEVITPATITTPTTTLASENKNSDTTTSNSNHNKENATAAAISNGGRTKSRSSKTSTTTTTTTTAAEAGIIKSIYCENFMCHRRFSVDLSRNVTFIHGQNGSGTYHDDVVVAMVLCSFIGDLTPYLLHWMTTYI
jgi:hypothetical protein